MRPSWQRVLIRVLAVSVLALVLAPALPHRHDPGTLSHTASACRACKLQESAAAASSAPVFTAFFHSPDAPAPILSHQSVRSSLIVRLPASRAPPVSS